KEKKQKKTKGKPENDGEVEGNVQSTNSKTNAGWSVLLKPPKSNVAERQKDTDNPNDPLKDDKRKGRKRKADNVTNGDGEKVIDNTTGKTGNKKVKPNDTAMVNGTNRPIPNGAKTSEKSTSTNQKKPVKEAFKSDNLRDKLVESLKGSRFRFINEQLYKIPGEEAKKMFQQDPASFKAYHDGYRLQVEQWPMNPLDRMIKSIQKMPKDTIVADFGCGEAKLAASVQQKVYSLDLVSNNNGVIACDMANTPLESNFVNVVVFCLSLMGTNLVDFLLEANRVLKVGGILKIAEVASRFENVNEFVNNVKKCGFELGTKDLKNKLFYFFIFKKNRTVLKGSTKIKPFSLKPCLYKKR
uniref:Ribosomal RNA-processing protein 8 n=1 Tax=Anopheles epiroticus TaxID=199890 RepID=A0A182P2N0_9DIPT